MNLSRLLVLFSVVIMVAIWIIPNKPAYDFIQFLLVGIQLGILSHLIIKLASKDKNKT